MKEMHMTHSLLHFNCWIKNFSFPGLSDERVLVLKKSWNEKLLERRRENEWMKVSEAVSENVQSKESAKTKVIRHREFVFCSFLKLRTLSSARMNLTLNVM